MKILKRTEGFIIVVILVNGYLGVITIRLVLNLIRANLLGDSAEAVLLFWKVKAFLLLIFLLSLLILFVLGNYAEKLRRWSSKKQSFRSYLSEDAWIDVIPGSRNGDVLLLSYNGFLRASFALYRLVSSHSMSNSVTFIPAYEAYVSPQYRGRVMLFGIVDMVVSLVSLFYLYCNVGSGSNYFDKKNRMVYITRYGLPGKGRCTVLQVPMKDIPFLILKMNPDCGDVLYMKTREQGTLALTPVNTHRTCNLMEKGVELSKFLNVPLQIVSSNYEESK